MPTANVNDATLHYRIDGPDDAPVMLVSNSLASNLAMWDHQVDTLIRLGFRVLRYDSRGHGQSEVTAGPYSIELLAGDAVGLLDGLGIERASFMGCSMGGMVGQMVGTRHGDRFDRLVLCSTSAYMGGADVWAGRIEAVAGGRDGRGGRCDDRSVVHRAWTGADSGRGRPNPGDDSRDTPRGIHRVRPRDRLHGPARDDPVNHPAHPGRRR